MIAGILQHIDTLIVQASPARLGTYMRLFAVVALLLGAFMLGVVLIGYLRRRRLARAERRRLGLRAENGTIPDAWTEAGRRDAPYTERPRQDAADASDEFADDPPADRADDSPEWPEDDSDADDMDGDERPRRGG